MNKKAIKSSTGWVLLLLIAFLEFVFIYILNDKAALASSIYTYYFDSYYIPLSSGKIPWISFKFEYPPLAAYALLFPGLLPGLTALSLTILRAGFCFISSGFLIFSIQNNDRIQDHTKRYSCGMLVVLALIVPGFYFGLFDWYLVIANIMIALCLSNQKSKNKLWTWVALGSTIKLMPLLSIPFLYEKIDKSYKSSFAKTLAVTTFINLPFFLFGFLGFKNFISYHRMRSIDTFSIYACVLNTLQNLGLTKISREWNFGALEVQGSFSQTLSKISLPLFGLVFIFLVLFHFKSKKSMQVGFAIYSSSIILYTVLSKVSQSNYVLWVIASLVAVWIAGYDRTKFIKLTSILGVVLVLIAFFQDRFFSDFLSDHVPWRMIFVSSVRHVIGAVLACLILKEAIAGKESIQLSAATV